MLKRPSERDEAEKARVAAEQARDDAKKAEAKLALERAERRADAAEERSARAEKQEACLGKSNPNTKPVVAETKEAVKTQIQRTIAQKKELAEQATKPGEAPAVLDVAKSLRDPNHVFLVSKTLSVTLAEDGKYTVMVSNVPVSMEAVQEALNEFP